MDEGRRAINRKAHSRGVEEKCVLSLLLPEAAAASFLCHKAEGLPRHTLVLVKTPHPVGSSARVPTASR